MIVKGFIIVANRATHFYKNFRWFWVALNSASVVWSGLPTDFQLYGKYTIPYGPYETNSWPEMGWLVSFFKMEL